MNTEDRKFYIYVHMRGTDDSVFYVGKGCGPRYKVKSTRNEYWKRTVAKYGFTAEIVQKNLTFTEANEEEIKLIKELRSQGVRLCNIADGGQGSKGWKKTQEQIEHHRKVTTGMKRSEESKAKMKGRVFSKEALERIGKAHKGLIMSEEARKKMSDSAKLRKRIPHSEESKKRMSEAKKEGWKNRKGYKTPDSIKKKISDSLKNTLAAKRQMKTILADIQLKENYA